MVQQFQFQEKLSFTWYYLNAGYIGIITILYGINDIILDVDY